MAEMLTEIECMVAQATQEDADKETLVPDPVESDTNIHIFTSKVNEDQSTIVYEFEEPVYDKFETPDLEKLISLLQATKLEATAAYIKRTIND